AWLAVTSPAHRWRNLGLVALAVLPAGLLAFDYFEQTGFFSAGGANRLRDHAWQWLRGQGSWRRLNQELTALDDELFTHHAQAEPLGLIALALYLLLGIVTVFAGEHGGHEETEETGGPSRWPVAVLALAS